MKFLLFVAAVLALVWLLRGSSRRAMPPPAAAPKAVQDMVRCAQCGMHLPAAEALPGRGGVFCSEAHRAEFERLPPGP